MGWHISRALMIPIWIEGLVIIMTLLPEQIREFKRWAKTHFHGDMLVAEIMFACQVHDSSHDSSFELIFARISYRDSILAIFVVLVLVATMYETGWRRTRRNSSTTILLAPTPDILPRLQTFSIRYHQSF
ncbi:hypothetical protein BT63DRAFT_184831 [Microthyrium microscopicum]|uniref:Uncharacterized protein n=1 Tax=Microthyrium microscopicum TaxID=703497 RepID=A0A6A6ULK9_9PEZI|nr:hypothetical protein BT63DRAFT_184831 [Microthyrium microscopicum]